MPARSPGSNRRAFSSTPTGARRGGTTDRPESYQTVTWSLSGEADRTELEVRETNLPSDEAKQTSDQTWPMVLANLKRVVESDQA